MPPLPAKTNAQATEHAPAEINVPRINSSDLFGAERELLITHKGTQYRLRLTRQDKLILTK